MSDRTFPVADIEVLSNGAPSGEISPCLVVEVPHGADRRAHYDALRALIAGALPDDLHAFFHVNTDVGAWQLGRQVARSVVSVRPGRRAIVIRCLIPRTFIDCNRIAGAPDALARGGLTPGLQPYVRHPADQALLRELHRRYIARVTEAMDRVCGGGGLALTPHTYAPRSVGIARVDDQIVENMRWAWSPEQLEAWPLRPEIDLITRTPEGEDLAIPGAAEALRTGFAALGIRVAGGETYALHPATQGAAWAARYPGQTLCLEVRRDLLVEAWTPFEEMAVVAASVERLAGPIAATLDRALRERGR